MFKKRKKTVINMKKNDYNLKKIREKPLKLSKKR